MKTSLSQLVVLVIVASLATTADALPPWKAKFKRMFVAKGPKSLQTLFADNAIGSCKVCHVNLLSKKVRNPFGKELDKLIKGNAAQRLKAAAKEGAAARKAMGKQIDKELLSALEQVFKLPSPAGGGSYGERLKAGKLPFAPPMNGLTAKEKAAGWKLLFDGKTAKGWNNWRTKKALELGKWVVADNALTLKPGGGDIYTAKKYENFELVMEWKTAGNSGIMIRIDSSQRGPIYKVAPEMQIERKMGERKTDTAALYDIYPVEGKKVIFGTGWNVVRIRMVNGEGTHYFNGVKVYSYKIGSDDWKKRIAKSKWRNTKGFGETANGHIGLQDHGAAVSFRNIKIRQLKGK